MRKTKTMNNSDAVGTVVPDTRKMVSYILSKIPEADRFAAIEAIRGISLNAIEYYLSSPPDNLVCFFKDAGLFLNE